MNLLLDFDSSQWKNLTLVTKPFGSLDGDGQQEQVCTLKIQNVKNLQNSLDNLNGERTSV